MAYPSVLSAISNPQATDRLNSPSHSSIHQAVNTAITEIETFVGTQSSTVGTLYYDIRSANSNGGGHVQSADKGGTGQTAYTKGDILVAQSASVLTKLAIGATNQVLTADATQAVGVKWGSPAAVVVTSLLSTGVWTRPSGFSATSKTLVELWGGGGGGGAASVTGGATGGGGGSYINSYYSTSLLSSSILVAIGIGGTGCAAVAGSQPSIGGRTVFDPTTSMLTAFGGGAGFTSTNLATLTGGNGAGIFMDGFNIQGTGNPGDSSIFGGQGGYPAGSPKQKGQSGNYIGGAGGGAGGGASASVYADGGTALMGGSGGGGVTSAVMGTGGLGLGGGAGSNASILTSASVASGSIPSGGGGAGYGTGAIGGAGGAGKAIITTFL